ncbi:hypothetical protein BX616_008420 [Lobosporangium transversale]|uniref:Uncharacterized protein n=1 Tax=Lobosporangium transversale TaxID=64571 RepID=A0A1Y2GLP5_9FUNG|nr:hypothetical protein BCR41DRAFT_396658 [Lobosporangium transversale]KAF9914385.1 hypothetical protein BX616_008420 [Lobosporangium transversale]ORZ14936.1 hypothetical protein BCR41DRAFT_396658 [Lobosporangium transversale]|eukprot:XP_021881068.1 hypothetical protein BCR41DRAFT_396658 [Lobosporangium transversale]
MIKLLTLVLVAAQTFTIVGIANATHYIAFARGWSNGFTQKVGVCIRGREGLIMQDYDTFWVGVKNYGFHKDGYSALVGAKDRQVRIPGWGVYQLQSASSTHDYWLGCWNTSPNKCSEFYSSAKEECENFFKKKIDQSIGNN